MRLHPSPTRPLFPALALVAWAAPALAATETVTFVLDGVVDPGGQTEVMSGTFSWTYTPGDFENGTGAFTAIDLPGFGTDLSQLAITIEPQQIDISLNGNYHGYSVDVLLRLVQPFSPFEAVALDLAASSYQIENAGWPPNAAILSGSVAPLPGYASLCFGDGSGAPCPCGNPGGPGEGCAHSGGHGASLAASGGVDVATDDLAIGLSGGPGNVPALLFAGTQAVQGGVGVPFGDGLRCAGGAVRRLGVHFLDAAGAASWGPGLGAAGGWLPGESRVFQVWYRDPVGAPCGASFNTSQAVAVTFAS